VSSIATSISIQWCLCCRWVSVHSTMQELIIKICYNATKIRPWRYDMAGPQVTRVICRGKYLLLDCVTNEPFQGRGFVWLNFLLPHSNSFNSNSGYSFYEVYAPNCKRLIVLGWLQSLVILHPSLELHISDLSWFCLSILSVKPSASCWPLGQIFTEILWHHYEPATFRLQPWH